MMDSLEQDYATILLNDTAPPCVSLYQPTHRHHPDNAQDPIRFRNLVDSIEASLRSKYDKQEVAQLLGPFEKLGRDTEFWNHTLDGLAVLAAPGLFRAYRLQRRVPELAIAADSFHLKPLHRVIQSADRFQLLGVTRDAIRLFEGNRDIVDEIEPADGVPRTLVDALGSELTEPHLTVSSYGTGAGGPAMHHGQGSRKDEIDIDAERFFRAVDRAVLDRHSRPSQLPLLLVGVPDNQGTFRRVTRNPFLVETGIDADPEALSTEALRERAWSILEPKYVERLARLVDRFNEAHDKGLASDDLDQAAAAACAGRIATLLVDADCELAGHIDAAEGRAVRDALSSPHADDILDDLGTIVTRHGGEWIIVPPERMPTRTGLAAIFRY